MEKPAGVIAHPTFQVLRKRGTLYVVRQPPPESLSADLWQRLHGVMESVA